MRRNDELVRVLVALGPGWFGWTASQALIGWLVFAASGSPALVGLAFALRFLPFTLAGLPAGTLSDHFGRLRLLRTTNAIAAIVALLIAVFVSTRLAPVAVLLGASVCLGVVDSIRIVTGTNLVYDVSGPIGATRAIAASNLVAGIGSALGGVFAGVTLSRPGPAVTAVAVGLAYASSVLLLRRVPEVSTEPRETEESFMHAARQGLRLVRTFPVVGLLITLTLVIEVFAFSSIALDPVFAGAVFGAGPLGLGVILTTRSIGRIVGSAALVIARLHLLIGRPLSMAVCAFGLALAFYSAAPILAIGVGFLLVAGIAGVWVDALLVAALQGTVDQATRGRVTGLWVLALGLQPIGLMELAGVAQAVGPRPAQAVNGIVVIAFGLLMLLTPIGRRFENVRPSNRAA